MLGVLRLAATALVVSACAGPTATASTTATPPATPPATAAAATYGVSVANGLTVPVAVYVNGALAATVPAGTTEDPVPAALPAKPWTVEARSPRGLVLATMTVSMQDYISATSGKVASADLSCGRLELWSGPPTTGGPTFVPDPSRPCDAPAIDEARAGQIARDYFATAHGTGITLSDVTQTDNGITNDTACGSAWEVLMGGTVTESSGASYFSTMYLCVDPMSGTVTRGPAG